MTLIFSFIYFLLIGITVATQRFQQVAGSDEDSKSRAAIQQPSPPNTETFFALPPGFQTEPDLDEDVPALAPGGKIVKRRQGPFTLFPGEQVEHEAQWIPVTQLPCKDCYITAIQGGLEFEDGSPAYVDSGAFLQVCLLVSE
jgi:hypothetical protein